MFNFYRLLKYLVTSSYFCFKHDFQTSYLKNLIYFIHFAYTFLTFVNIKYKLDILVSFKSIHVYLLYIFLCVYIFKKLGLKTITLQKLQNNLMCFFLF